MSKESLPSLSEFSIPEWASLDRVSESVVNRVHQDSWVAVDRAKADTTTKIIATPGAVGSLLLLSSRGRVSRRIYSRLDLSCWISSAANLRLAVARAISTLFSAI